MTVAFDLMMGVSVFLSSACAGQNELIDSTYAGQDKLSLRVALFPYLPGADAQNEALRVRLESEFEALHRDVDLDLRRFDPNEDFYDPLFVGNLLRGADAYDIVEVDTVLLGALLDMEAISAWTGNLTRNDWNPIAAEAGRVDGRIYGVPHWMCGHFIMTQSQVVAHARTLDELILELEGVNSHTRNLAGDLLGSWNTAALYLDAWADTRSEAPQVALGMPLDTNVVTCLVRLAGQGNFEGRNPCIDGTYKKAPALAAEEFGTGHADALLGYLERLYYATAYLDPAKILIASAPLGDGSDPLWFVDSLVYRNDQDDEDPQAIAAKRSAARQFVDYLSAPSTFGWIHAGEDIGPGSRRRYLIPATNSAMTATGIVNDPVMQQLRPMLTRGTSFPRNQLPGTRRAISAKVQAAWSQATQPPAQK